jgi:hypothetical protein
VTRHPDADVLADYREGLLGRRRQARVRAHLNGCADCSCLVAGLAEVTELLASAPAPRMPDHLIARLENALAAEVASRDGATATDGAAGAQDGEADGARIAAGRAAAGSGRGERRRGRLGTARQGSPRQREPWPRRPAVLGAAAAVALIVAGGAYGLSRLGNQPGASSASSAVGGSARAPASSSSTPNSHDLGPANLPANAKAGPGGILPPAELHEIRSGTDYLPSHLASQVESVLAGHETAVGPLPTSEPDASAALRACVALITGGVPPELVDVARYQGQPATVIVSAAAAGKPRQVWVAGPGCSATNRDLLAHTELAAIG